MQYAFNLFSHNAPVLPNGYNEEEMKLVKETKKIWVSIFIPSPLDFSTIFDELDAHLITHFS